MKKTYLLNGFVAMAMGLAAVGCSHDADYSNAGRKNQAVADYNKAFVKVFGEPAEDQDWGFGTSGTRAAATWDGSHTCAVSDWNTVLKFTVPSNAVDLTKGSFTEADKKATAFVIPATHRGDLNFNAFNIPAGAKIYNLGKTTSFTGANYDGLVTFYNGNDAEFRFIHATATRHTFVNIGTLTLVDYAHVGEVYNGGTLMLEGAEKEEYVWNPDKNANDIFVVKKADVPNEMKIYSNGTGGIMADCDVDLKSVCDIHGTLNVTGNLKIQNGTSKYICGIKATGTVENVDGLFYTSYINADKFTVDGNETYLLSGGHIKANTVHVYNSGCSIKAAAGSTALIEAKDFIFANDNDFERTVSDNVYFQISGSIDMTGVTNGSVKEKKKFDNADAYIAANGNPNNKLNAGDATGSPACGNTWTVGNPDPNWKFLCRVFAEDLSAQDDSDFDFNDVVFDVYHHKTEKKTKIQLLAAGGTLPLLVAGYDVKEQFGVSTSTIVNTGEDIGVVNGLEADSIVLDSIVQPDKIVIAVSKGGPMFQLEAHKGEPASKFAVPKQIDWSPEYHDIRKKYPKFEDWVGDPSVKWYE